MADEKVPAPGKKIRDYKVTITDGSSSKLSELTGKNGLVIYFYPKDMTPGCTTEACDFRDNLKRLEKLGYKILGVSADDVKRHQKFTEKQDLNFPLAADEDQKLSNAFGVWGEKKLYGKTFMGIKRTTFVLDKGLKVSHVYEKVKVKGHVDQIMSDLSGK